MPKTNLAVIIPCYLNDPLFLLKKAVDSVLNQTFREMQLFIAVDGPVKPEVHGYLDDNNHGSFEVLYYEKNRGLAAALNASIRHVIEKGYQYIGRMDADDTIHPKRFEKQIEFLLKNPDVAVVGTQGYIIDPDDNIIGTKDSKRELTYKALLVRSDIIHASAVFRDEFFDIVGYYNDHVSRAEDYDLWFRAIKLEVKIKSISDRLYYIRHDKYLIERRKLAQKHIIQVKMKYISFFEYIYLVQHYLIWFMPDFLLRIILRKSIKE